MEDNNKYIKRQRIYKIIMLMVLTAFITSILTAMYVVNLGENNQQLSTGNSSTSSILSSLTNDSNLSKSLKFIEKLVKSKYLNASSIDETKAIDGAIEGYIDSLGDEYTDYIPADKMKDYTESIMGNFVGIGIYMVKNTEKNLVQVLSPIRESPAEKAGIKAGDLITKVNGVTYTADQMSEMADKIKGEAGSKVNHEILRGEQLLTFEVIREKVNTNPVYSEKLENNIGYLDISSFDDGTAEDFKAKYLSLKEQGIKGLIIDLRDNGGGIVDEALKIVDYIVPKNQTTLITVDKDGKEEVTKSKEDKLIEEPVVVLVNASSASASEIMAGALKDLNVAQIVGTKTYGKGVIQQLLTLTNGAGLKITVEEYYTPNKTKINKVGITPDYEVLLETSVTREPTDANDTQLNKAKEILKEKIGN